MLETKTVEIRDRATLIPAIAMLIRGGSEDRLLWRAGFGPEPCVLLVHISDGQANYDAFNWPNRTMREAHRWLNEHWEEHSDGGVVDVEFILGETATPKVSEVSR